jgi:hypothetical protein
VDVRDLEEATAMLPLESLHVDVAGLLLDDPEAVARIERERDGLPQFTRDPLTDDLRVRRGRETPDSCDQ